MMRLYMRTWKTIGTTAHVITTVQDDLDAATEAVTAVVEDVDETYSRFRDDSELSHLNASAGRTVPVSPLMALAITAGERAAILTDGAVDPTIGEAIRVAGYDDDFARLQPDRGPVRLRAVRVPGWRALRFNRATRTISMPPGVELDLGSLGKALAADLAVAAAGRALSPGAGLLVSLGGDIATVGDAPADGWRILVAEDSRSTPDGDGQTVAITGGALATSSTTVRRWTRGGRVLHHIIDPRTGAPTTGPWRTVTTAAPTCVDANMASTAAIVLGEDAIAWLEARQVPARLVEEDGTIHYVGRWPDTASVAA